MELIGIKDFSVLFFAPGIIRGAKFKREEKQWKLVRHLQTSVDENNPADAWKHVLRSIQSRDGLLILCGALPDGIFFQFKSTELAIRDQRGVVQLELPRRLMNNQNKNRFQFAASLPQEDLQVNVGVYVFQENALNSVVARMTQSSCHADAMIYPLLALEPGDPGIYLPEIEKDFAFADGSWTPVAEGDDSINSMNSQWIEIFKKCMLLPEDDSFDPVAMLPLLLCARMVISGKYQRNSQAFAILPEQFRPVRFRRHITISVILVVLLIFNLLWHFSRTWGADYRLYKSLQSENKKLKRDLDLARRSSKKLLKEQKEMERVIASGSGETELVAKLAILSNAMPGNVLVSSIRWNDSGIDIVLQCEDAKLDLPAIINPLGLWKIGQLQQRQNGDSAVATITLKLIPLSTGDSK